MTRKSSSKKSDPIIPEANMVIDYAKSMRTIKAITDSQKKAYRAWDTGENLILSGAPGTGKTFIAIYLSLLDIIKNNSGKKLVIVRSVVPTRDIGYLPGTQEEKEAAYLNPYIGVVTEIFKNNPTIFGSLVKAGMVEFLTTSFIRGITIKDSIVVVDEFQNCNFHELDSIITRIGKGSRLIFSGDYYQSDFSNKREQEGIISFLRILDKLKHFTKVDFTWDDCVRSGIVKDYLITKDKLMSEGLIVAK